jgi:hypothetical protein
MRFPDPYMEEIEAEAKAKGISVPELCRRIIIERNEATERDEVIERETERNKAIEREKAKAVQVTPNPKPLMVVSPSGSPGTGTPRPVTIPAAPFKTETVKCAEESLMKLAEKHPEAIANWILEQINKGKMSMEEVAKFLGGLESRM